MTHPRGFDHSSVQAKFEREKNGCVPAKCFYNSTKAYHETYSENSLHLDDKSKCTLNIQSKEQFYHSLFVSYWPGYACTIWALFLRGNIICLQLVKIEILDPSGGVFTYQIGFGFFLICKIQILRHSDFEDPHLKCSLQNGLGPLQQFAV